MTYHLVYDVASAGYQEWWFPAVGLVFVAIGAAFVFAPDFMRSLMPGGLQGTARGCFSWFFFLFAIVWTIIATWTTLGTYLDLRGASIGNDCTTVAGVVSDFRPMPYSGHSMESFSVGGAHFEFSDYVISGGFNQTASHGGPIREGLPVKICYVQRSSSDSNIIVRLETAGEAPVLGHSQLNWRGILQTPAVMGTAFAFFFACGIAQFPLARQLRRVLVERHPDVWAEIERKSLSIDSAVMKFATSRRAKDLNDPEISRAASRIRWLQFIAVGSWLVIAASMLVGTWF